MILKFLFVAILLLETNGSHIVSVELDCSSHYADSEVLVKSPHREALGTDLK